MTGIMQAVLGCSFGFANGWPVANIGDAYGGGFFAGQINVSGTKYNLVVAPKASGETSGFTWGTAAVTTGITSVINGPTNSASLAALGAGYQPAVFCEGLTIGGYSDWYLPAKNELEVLYYYLKPDTSVNFTSSGSNANAVSPEPISTNYSSGSPGQTTASSFMAGGANALANISNTYYWSSTESTQTNAWAQLIYYATLSGIQLSYDKQNASNVYVRAVRRVPV